jgi:hypothetical protein
MWTSKKYKRAAEKHFKSCKHILNCLNQAKPHEKSEVVSNIFYLSGYVLECIFKHYYLELDHKSGTFNLQEIEDMGLKSHNIQKLWDLVSQKGRLNKHDFIWTSITNKWNESVRYETDDSDYKNENLIREHFTKTVEPIYNKIKDLY